MQFNLFSLINLIPSRILTIYNKTELRFIIKLSILQLSCSLYSDAVNALF